MSNLYKALFFATVAALVLAACGDDSDDFRPIEILYFVQGPTGGLFEIVDAGDNDDCLAQSRQQEGTLVPSEGYGFQSASATHLLPGTFQAPHYFVFENEGQPARGVFRNLGNAPLTVLQMRGLAPPATTVETRIIPAGECRSVSTFDDEDEIAGIHGPIPGEEFRVEVCSFAEGTVLPEDFRCQDLAPRGTVETDAEGNPLSDIGAAFIGSIGDFTASFLTRCLQFEASEQIPCRTPATFYMHDPRDQISVAMTRFPNQADSFLQLDLYRGDRLIDSDRGSGDVVARDDI
jgi:hypothetical protein